MMGYSLLVHLRQLDLLSIVEDTSPAAAVPEHFEVVGFNCKRAFFETQTDYSLHIILQYKDPCSIVLTVMTLAKIFFEGRGVSSHKKK